MPGHVPEAPEFGAASPVRQSDETLALLAARRSSSPQALRAPAPQGKELADLIRLAARAPDHGKIVPWRFVVLEGDAKAAFVEGLKPLAEAQANPTKAQASLRKLAEPPMVIAVVSAPREGAKPIADQIGSAYAVATLMLVAAEALGYGANWITDWYGEDETALQRLGLDLQGPNPETLAAWILLGTPAEAPLERQRPDVAALTTVWRA